MNIYVPEENATDWSCRFEIDWSDGARRGVAAGIDSAQALLHASEKIGVEIYTSDHHKSGELKGHELNKGYGFPVPQSLRDLLMGVMQGFYNCRPVICAQISTSRLFAKAR